MEAAKMNLPETQFSVSRPKADALVIRLSGDWRVGHDLPNADGVRKELESGSGLRTVSFDTSEITGWDSNL